MSDEAAAAVLTLHAPARRGAVECRCGWFGSSRRAWGRDHAVHQAHMLAAAGLLATAEHEMVQRLDILRAKFEGHAVHLRATPGPGDAGSRGEADAWEGAARAIAALLDTAEPVVIEVHHHDIEEHAASFNEGYETAVAQGLADDPTLAADWLTEHDAQVAAQAARQVIKEAIDLLHSEARWQYEQHLAGRAAAQAISLRVSMLEQILRDRIAAGEQP